MEREELRCERDKKSLKRIHGLPHLRLLSLLPTEEEEEEEDLMSTRLQTRNLKNKAVKDTKRFHSFYLAVKSIIKLNQAMAENIRLS